MYEDPRPLNDGGTSRDFTSNSIIILNEVMVYNSADIWRQSHTCCI